MTRSAARRWSFLLESPSRASGLKYGDRGLTAVGVHTPEFEHERRREAVVEHSRRHGLHFSHLLDNDYAYWNALGNQYWPTLYLVDRCGRIRERSIGEVHLGQARGHRLEARVRELLAETAGDCQ